MSAVGDPQSYALEGSSPGKSAMARMKAAASSMGRGVAVNCHYWYVA